MYINASKENLLEIIQKAINASSESNDTLADKHLSVSSVLTQLDSDDNVDVSIFAGKSVELYINFVREGVYEILDKVIDSEKQTWAFKYPSYRELVESAIGVWYDE